MTDGAPGYTFGNNPTAADRLLLVARVFDTAMAAVLATLPTRRWQQMVDLGCGPGSSTERLLHHLDVERCSGIDASADFVAAARARVPGAEFAVGDVLAPWPVSEPDLVYARYLLSHLADPVVVVQRWGERLAPGGHLVLEEPDTIASDDDVVNRYLSLTSGAVASRGADMYVGRTLASVPAAVNRTFPLDVSVTDAAAMFAMNLASVRTDPWVRDRHDDGELDDLADELAARRNGRVAAGSTVRWEIRQVVVALAE